MELHSEETVQYRGALALPAALCTQERPLDLICQAAEVLAQPPIRLVLETTERQIPGGALLVLPFLCRGVALNHITKMIATTSSF